MKERAEETAKKNHPAMENELEKSRDRKIEKENLQFAWLSRFIFSVLNNDRQSTA